MCAVIKNPFAQKTVANDSPPHGNDSAPAPFALAPWLGAFRFCVSRSRFSVLLLVLGLALLLSDQGRDLLIAYGEDHKTVRLAAMAFLWALSLWWCSRVLLDIRYADHPRHTRAYDFWRKVLPRALGSIAFLVIAFGAMRAQRYALSAAALAALVAFLAWVITRRRVTRAAATRLRASRAPLVARAGSWIDVEEFGPPPHAGLRVALGFERGDRSGLVIRPATMIAFVLALIGIVVLETIEHVAAKA